MGAATIDLAAGAAELFPATGEAVEEPIYRAGAWWIRRADGHWIYWNVRRDAWDFHPYGPPVVSASARTSELPAEKTPPPPPSGYTPPPPPSGYTPPSGPPPSDRLGGSAPPPPPPPAPSSPFPGAPPVQPPPAQWPDPGPPGSPMPQPYSPARYVPKPKPAPVWAAGSPVVFADWWPRAFALLIDLLVVGGPTVLVLAIVDAAMVPGSLDPFTNQIHSTTRAVAMIVALALCYIVFFSGYFALLNGADAGATLGKRLMRIRVADQYDGSSIGPGRAFLRWVLMGAFWGWVLTEAFWVVLYVPGLLNLLWPVWDPQRQTWHDKLANSVVVTTPR
jgi:uncharacterized RDD family membrane protein YckC